MASSELGVSKLLECPKHTNCQQDGGPPRFAILERQYWDQMYPNRWIERACPISKHSYSPDLTRCDHFLCRFLKDTVYHEPLSTTPELKTEIFQAAANIAEHTLKISTKTQKSFMPRNERGNSYFEQLLN